MHFTKPHPTRASAAAQSRGARRPWVRGVASVLLAAAVVLCAAPAARAKTEVRIEGNTALGAKVLREAAAAELAGLKDPARRSAAAEDAAYQMVHAGRQAGYAFIQVDHEITRAGEDLTVVFRVREGPKVALGEVTFPGNASLPVAELRGSLAPENPTPYVAAEVRAGRSRLVQLYREQGFSGATVGEPVATLRADRNVVDVAFEIVEGTRFLIAGVAFEGDAVPEAGPALGKARAGLLGQPYFERRKLTLGNQLLKAYGALGYPDAVAVVRDEPGKEAGDVVLRVVVTSGLRVRVTRVDVTGNKRTKAWFIRSRIPVHAGEWYNEETLQEGFLELYRTGVFSRVGSTLEGDGAERVLRVEVEESPARELSAEIGWGSYELLRGRVGFRDRNFLGTGRGAGAEVGASAKSYFVTADTIDPRFFGTDFSLSTPISWRLREEPTYTEEEVELAVRLQRVFPRRITAGVTYGYRFDGLSDVSADVPADAADERYNSSSVKVNLDIDRRDDIFYPAHGWQTGLTAEVADQRMGGTLDFVRCTGAAKGFLSLGAGFVAGLRLQSGFVVPTRGNEEIPVGERFFTGGENSVRSFEEGYVGPKGASGDPLGGLASTVVSVELRRRIWGGLAASVFADLGNVSPNRSLGADPGGVSTVDQADSVWKDYLKDFRAGVGFGVQYVTPLGPARLDLAWNPDPRAAEGEADFAWHFSFGMAF